MLAQRAIRLSLLLIFALEAVVELFLLRSGELKISGAWFLLVLVIIGSATLFLGREQRSTTVLCLLLASIAVLVSQVLPGTTDWGQAFGTLPGMLLNFFWDALLWLLGFVFVHYSLIFPIESPFVRRRPGSVYVVYIPYILLLGLTQFSVTQNLAGGLLFVSMLLGLSMGLAILIRKYITSLTSAEKNRLRIVLIGCLAGALPTCLAAVPEVLGVEGRSRTIQDLGLYMFPLFPLGLVGAVLIENLAEIGKWLQRTLTYSLAAAGTLTAFFLCYWISSLLLGDAAANSMIPLLPSSALALACAYPLVRWSGSYICAQFCAPDESRPVPLCCTPSLHPIDPNPYIVGNPVRSPEMFFGREEDFQFIRTKLHGEQQGCLIVLCGERRTGKTSILYQILNGRLGGDFLPIFVDMQGMVVQRDSEFLEELRHRIQEAVSPDPGRHESPPPETPVNYLEFNRFMDGIMAGVGARRLVLLIDEYELIETKVNDAKLGAEVYGYFNSLLLRYPRLSFVFTGSRTLRAGGAWTALVERSIYRNISFLARKDAQELVCAPLRNRAFFESGMVNDLLRLTHGQPFFTQAVCQTLVEVLNEHQTNIVNRRALDETVRRMLENPPPQLFYQWTTFSDSEKLVLAALATLLKKPESYLSADRIEKLARTLPGDFANRLDASTIRMHFENLRERAILDRDQNRYRFTMDLVRLWVQSEHNVWKVLSEIAQPGRKTNRRE